MSARLHRVGLVAAFLLGAAGGCAVTGLGEDCPQGYDVTNNACVCSSDQGCPTGYVCKSGLCACNSGVCCPAGYAWNSTTQQCVCGQSSCCPVDYAWDPNGQACYCAASSCCPDGFALDPLTGRCGCNGAQCCPQGFTFVTDAGFLYPDGGIIPPVDGGSVYGPPTDGGPWVYPDGGDAAGGEFGMCSCADDSCCPINYRYDGNTGSCTCAESLCCPSDYAYLTNVRGCVCAADACCPTGYTQNADKTRCVCGPTTDCGTGRSCDVDAGTCICVDNSACGDGGYCNSLGFCQTLSGCVSNVDCPSGDFCDVTTSLCTTNVPGTCIEDSQCPFSQICNLETGTCVPGCRTTDDCALGPIPALSCQNGQCVPVCEGNDFCAFQDYCGSSSETPGCPAGSCCPATNTDFCADCDPSDPSATVCTAPDACLQFIIEGQTIDFCGVPCNVDSDCPSGYECGETFIDCSNVGNLACSNAGPDAAGNSTTCEQFLTENEAMPESLCADTVTGQPGAYQSYCAPLSGTCPGVN